jgi:hypothetical protein
LEAKLDGTFLLQFMVGKRCSVTASDYCHFINRIVDVVAAHGRCW